MKFSMPLIKKMTTKVTVSGKEPVVEEIAPAVVGNRKRTRALPPGETPKPKKKTIPVRETSFHITINTNQRYGSKDAIVEDMRPLYNAMTETFGDLLTVEAIIEILREEDEFAKVVGATHADVGVEYSEKAGLHAHVLLTITHKTKLRIHLKNLRRILDEKLPHLAKKAPHTFVRYVPDERKIVKNYIYKMVGDEQLKLREGMTFEETPKCTCDCKIADMTEFFSE